MPNTAFTDPTSHIITRLAFGLPQQIAIEPLVAIHKGRNSVALLQSADPLYIPDGVTPRLDPNFDEVEQQPTEAGQLSLRQIYIDYDQPNPRIHTFSLWEIRAAYIVSGESAEAVRC